MNQITGFLDGTRYNVTSNNYLCSIGSNVYGSDSEDEESLRLYKGGLLK